ncbi:class I SAM-dependent methyltransferase [Actinokineospora globicatena]|uniref:Methyltransferase n=1 Tax=Actinokineospora globicatena TaxID=103729 RepID=A0A9W6QIP5_9PSEU|nr:class I SAM-dependent methyltransferase [Actinokineospora globicatena]GLW90192.1 methyltransferase [Actinokineospora globicatena]
MARLLGDRELESSSVVANRDMNRERGLAGYRRELGVDVAGVVRPGARWLDLCCGSGAALVECARVVPGVSITGVDLVDFYAGPAVGGVEFVTASVGEWEPDGVYDLITCVHGLHYVGDKLGLLTRVASWLSDGGLFVANFDWRTVHTGRGRLTGVLREAGFVYDARRRRISLTGRRDMSLPFRYLGADDRAGPNYTGQPGVDSHYVRV